MNQDPTNPYSAPVAGGNIAPPRQGMPGWAKILLALGIVAGIGMVVCCGITGVMMYGGYQMAANALSTDPQVVIQRANEIAEMEVIDGYQPTFSVDITVPVTKQSVTKAAGFTRDTNHGILILGQVSRDMVGDDPQQIYLHLHTFLDGEHRPDDLETTTTEEREFMVRGEPARFEIARGKRKNKNDPEETAEFVRMLGSFPSKSGDPAIVMLVEEAEGFDAAAAEKMIASIK